MRCWKVTIDAPKKYVIVEADYFKVEGGVLTFRKVIPGNYPDPVHMFAPGYWREVTRDS